VKTARMSKEIWQGPRIVILISYCYPMMEYVGAIGHDFIAEFVLQQFFRSVWMTYWQHITVSKI
jgi:hypothetical protein